MRVRCPIRQASWVFVAQCGIEANPDKIKAIEQIDAPKRVKDVWRHASYVTALSRFISKSAERALPFFKILKKAGPMEWTLEAEAALRDLKKYLSSTPILVAPKPQEPLLLYLAATNQVVSAALVATNQVVSAALGAQREVVEGAVAMEGLADGEPELPPGGAWYQQGEAAGRV